MSVWEKTSYKLEVARNIYEIFGNFIDVILGPKAKPYLSPKGDLSDITGETTWEEVSTICSWALPSDDDDLLTDFRDWTDGATSWSVGTSAIYKLIHALYHGRFPTKEQYPYKFMDIRANAIGTAVVPSTQVSVRRFMAQWNAGDESLIKLSRRFEDFSEGWKYLYRVWKPDNRNLLVADMDQFFGSDPSVYEVAQARNLIVVRGCDIYTNQGLILTRTHVSFLIEASMRIANILDHAAREHVMNEPLRQAMKSMLELSINMGGKARRSNADKVVQAFHKARAFTQMILFENIEESARDDALDEFTSKGLRDVLDLEVYTNIFVGLPLGSWLEVIHIYKWMPPPDFDATSAFEELRRYHFSTRKSGLDDDATQQQIDLWQLVVKERKLNIACAYYKTFNKWPEGLKIEGEFPEEESLDIWEPDNLFPYSTYGKDIVSQIKDKATVLPTVSAEITGAPGNPNKNFLLWYLIHYGEIDTRVEAQRLMNAATEEENFARVAYKGEAHKPGSRLFFMAPPILRILLGELEGNISNIAAVYPASLQGTSTTVKDVRLHSLFDISMPADLEGYSGRTTCFVVTFDLSKFSPRFNPRVLQNLHQFWSKVYGYKPIEAMGDIGATGTILHTTNRLVMKYENQGADLEGFRGRMMTLFHADLISAACRYACKKGYIVGRAFSAVFIDDGAVRVFAKGEGEEARENASQFLVCLQDIYDAAGQENHPNKTIVSFIGGELLSEQFLFGQKLKAPIKAAMRLFPKYEHPATTIVDEFQSMFSTTQGSVKEGATWAVAYRRLADAYMKSIYRWARKHFGKLDNVQFALKFITPRSLGGFGFPSLQSITTTAALDMTSEGLGMLNAVGNGIKSYAPLVHMIIDRPIIRRDPLSILRDPFRIRMTGPVLVEGRLLDAIVRHLMKREGAWSKFLEAYGAEDLHDHARRVSEGLLSKEVFSAPVFIRAWEATPLAYVENVVMKFQKSDSIQAILPEHVVTKLRKANVKDVDLLVSTFFSRG